MRSSLTSATSLLALLLLDGQTEAVATPVVSASQPASFGYVLVGSTSAANSSLVTVSGQTAGTYLTVSAASSPFGGAGLKQSISNTATTSSSVSFTFTPVAAGAATQIETATDTSTGSNTVNLTLSGTGVAPIAGGPAAAASVSNYVLVGQTGTVSLTVSNTGNAYLAAPVKTVNTPSYNLNGSISAASNSVFVGTAASISLQDSNYTGTGKATSATYAYTFTPTVTGTQTATVTTKFSKGTGGSVGAVGATISFGSVGYAKAQTIYLALQNTSTDANGGNANLTIDKFTITGANASQFSVGSLTAGTIITEGSTLLIPVTVIGTSTIGLLNSTLTIFTDVGSSLGGAGDTFTYALTAMSVPEPASIAVLSAGLAGLAAARRRRRQ